MNIWTPLEETKSLLGKLQDLEGYFTFAGHQMEAKADGGVTLVCRFVHAKEEVIATSQIHGDPVGAVVGWSERELERFRECGIEAPPLIA